MGFLDGVKKDNMGRYLGYTFTTRSKIQKKIKLSKKERLLKKAEHEFMYRTYPDYRNLYDAIKAILDKGRGISKEEDDKNRKKLFALIYNMPCGFHQILRQFL